MLAMSHVWRSDEGGDGIPDAVPPVDAAAAADAPAESAPVETAPVAEEAAAS